MLRNENDDEQSKWGKEDEECENDNDALLWEHDHEERRCYCKDWKKMRTSSSKLRKRYSWQFFSSSLSSWPNQLCTQI